MHMFKKVILPAILILVVAGLVFAYFQNSKKSPVADKAGTPQSETTTVASLQDALTKSGSVSCAYDISGVNYKTYIKNGKVRSEVTSPDAKMSQSVLMIDKKIYFWNAQGAFVMEVPDITVTPQANTGTSGVSKKDEMMAQIEQYKESCTAGPIDDSLFVLPAGVKFEDYSAMMPKNPTGGAMTEEKVKEYMEKYGQQPQE